MAKNIDEAFRKVGFEFTSSEKLAKERNQNFLDFEKKLVKKYGKNWRDKF